MRVSLSAIGSDVLTIKLNLISNLATEDVSLKHLLVLLDPWMLACTENEVVSEESDLLRGRQRASRFLHNIQEALRQVLVLNSLLRLNGNFPVFWGGEV